MSTENEYFGSQRIADALNSPKRFSYEKPNYDVVKMLKKIADLDAYISARAKQGDESGSVTVDFRDAELHRFATLDSNQWVYRGWTLRRRHASR